MADLMTGVCAGQREWTGHDNRIWAPLRVCGRSHLAPSIGRGVGRGTKPNPTDLPLTVRRLIP
jgi:hypothetical protein